MAENKQRRAVAKNTKESEIVIMRIFDAPRELVWKAWTDPERMKRWRVRIFEEHDGKTTMTLKHVGMPAGEMSDRAKVGWNESFDKLAESL